VEGESVSALTLVDGHGTGGPRVAAGAAGDGLLQDTEHLGPADARAGFVRSRLRPLEEQQGSRAGIAVSAAILGERAPGVPAGKDDPGGQ
jgi:hypothetical protein